VRKGYWVRRDVCDGLRMLRVFFISGSSTFSFIIWLLCLFLILYTLILVTLVLQAILFDWSFTLLQCESASVSTGLDFMKSFVF
jgi:hypothetical protein